MDKIKRTLEKFGLSDKEVSVYLSLLKLGPSPVRHIANEAGVNRGTTYDILKSLQDLGLVAYYHKEKHQYFVAEDPNKLYDAVKQKIDRFKDLREELNIIVPQLRSMHLDVIGLEERPVVTYFDGTQGVRNVLQDVLDRVSTANPKEYFAYSSAAIRNYVYASYPDFTEERMKRNIFVKVIALGAGGGTVGLDARKWLSREQAAPTYTLIYAGRVAMLSTDKHGMPIGLIIADQGLFETQRAIFERLWQSL